MDLMPDEVQAGIAATAAALLAEHAPVEGFGASTAVRDVDADLWRRCCELGWIGLAVPESSGGVGLGLADEVFLFAELGRSLVNAPFLPSVLAARMAHRLGDAELCAGVLSGETRVGLEVAPWSATTDDVYVIHSDGAELLLGLSSEGAALWKVERGATRRVDPVDLSVAVARLARSERVPVAEIRDDGELLAEGRVLLAAMAAGVASAAMGLAVEYSTIREQFGKPIGSFQAVKHFAADMAVRCELSEAQVWYAALAVRDRTDAWRTEAAAALHSASEAARGNCESCVQIHGGIGFTSEALPHRFVARANLYGRLLGSRPDLLASIARSSVPGSS